MHNNKQTDSAFDDVGCKYTKKLTTQAHYNIQRTTSQMTIYYVKVKTLGEKFRLVLIVTMTKCTKTASRAEQRPPTHSLTAERFDHAAD